MNLNIKKKYNEPQRGIIALTEQVSETQAKILKELLADGRQTDNEIAKKIGETKGNVKKGILEMERMGVIRGATIHINYQSFGYKAVAHILINVDAQQEDQLVEYLQKMPELYNFYSRGVRGNLDAVAILKRLDQLNEIKDAIKRSFQILEMKSTIWTDVKETNYNLTVTNGGSKGDQTPVNYQVKAQIKNPKTITLDEIDQKIADKLAENGRVPMETLGKAVGISSDTAKRRYEKLKKNGALKVTIQIDPNKIGYQALCVFFTVTSNENPLVIIEKIGKIPNIISIMKTIGDYDLQIWAMAKDLGQFFSVRDSLGKIQGIRKMDAEILPITSFDKWPSPRQCISTF